MDNKELAKEFVKKYPNMFNNEKDNKFWIDEIQTLLDIANNNLIEKIEEQFKE